MNPSTPRSDLKIRNPNIPRGRFRFALFDFDGTLSLIRQGWQQVMVPMMVRILRETPTAENDAELAARVEEFVARLTGRQTIYQMIRLAQEVGDRGGKPSDPLEYKRQYHDLLMDRIRGRIEGLESRATIPDQWIVPGSRDLLEGLRARGMTLYLASGTDLVYVRHEAELLGFASYFGQHIYGAVDNYQEFSKRKVIERILAEHGLRGEELVGFGDGFVEIEEVKRVGGVAVAVASDEVHRRGIDAWKRKRLLEAGADLVIPEYREHRALLRYLFAEEEDRECRP